ncbi:MAG: hypothetical protein M3P12_09405, partial [Gemmatimonadota bacterium]|nr:hypothetical protein [Gemmatimonadota bacterium]
MIGLLLALQIAASTAAGPIPTFIFVRDGGVVTSVPVTINRGEASVRADALMRAMHGMVITGTNLHYTLALPRARLDLIDGIPFAKRDSLTIPLNRAPQVRGGQLYLPFQFVSEVIPRYGGGYSYDVVQAELRTSMPALMARSPTARTASTTPRASVITQPPSAAKPSTRTMVVIDAGHGGPDNGMTGPIGTP